MSCPGQTGGMLRRTHANNMTSEMLFCSARCIIHRAKKIRFSSTQQEMLITREFDAPRELVFKACTDPTLIPQWWGPRYLSTEVDTMDVRPGGQWRFIHRDAEGNAYAFHGVYHEVLAPERIIDTYDRLAELLKKM